MERSFDYSAAFERFLRDDAGEVTIAWVLITSAVVSMAVVVMTSIGGGAQEFSEKLDTELSLRETTTTY